MNKYANDFTSTVKAYYDDLKKFKPLSKSKEKVLLKKCKRGNLKAKNELLEANLKFVFETAKHYSGKGVPISELISEGNMGLLKAIEKFDYNKDVKFISYAVWWIRQSMLSAIKKKNILKFVEIEVDRTNEEVFDNKLFDEENDNNKTTQSFSLINQYDSLENINVKQKNIISDLINQLNEREKDIIESYYGFNAEKSLTLTDIGKKYNLSSERIRQIKKQCLKKMRSELLLHEDAEDLFFQ